MISMTGFGSSEFSDDKYKISIELKSYNNRYLDFSMNLPHNLVSLESEIKKVLSTKVSRGRVDLYMKFTDLDQSINLEIDENLLKQYTDLYSKIIAVSGITDKISLDNLTKIDGVILKNKQSNIEEIQPKIIGVLNQALSEFTASREAEGYQTFLDIKSNIEFIEEKVLFIGTYCEKIETKIKENLLTRFNEVVGDKVSTDRYLAETAVLLVKYSINEEIERLDSHLKMFKSLMTSDDAVGKKLDFLCQEINREVNTTASKSIFTEVNQAVVEIKNSLENIREQLRNVE